MAVWISKRLKLAPGAPTESIEAGHYVALGRPKGVFIKCVVLIPVHGGLRCAQGAADPIATPKEKQLEKC